MIQKKVKSEVFDNFIELQDIKDALRVSDDADDLLIETLVNSATDYCAAYIGYPLNTCIDTIQVTGCDGKVAFPADARREYEVLSVESGGQEVAFNFDGCELTVPDGVTDFTYKLQVKPVLEGRRFITSACYLFITKLYEQRGDETQNLTAGGWRSINALLDLAARRQV
jgi:hypothetical protein